MPKTKCIRCGSTNVCILENSVFCIDCGVKNTHKYIKTHRAYHEFGIGEDPDESK